MYGMISYHIIQLSIGSVRQVLSSLYIQKVHIITNERSELPFGSEGVLLLWWAPGGHGPRVRVCVLQYTSCVCATWYTLLYTRSSCVCHLVLYCCTRFLSCGGTLTSRITAVGL